MLDLGLGVEVFDPLFGAKNEACNAATDSHYRNVGNRCHDLSARDVLSQLAEAGEAKSPKASHQSCGEHQGQTVVAFSASYS